MNSNCRITLTLFLIVISSLLSQPAAARKSIKRPNVLLGPKLELYRAGALSGVKVVMDYKPPAGNTHD